MKSLIPKNLDKPIKNATEKPTKEIGKIISDLLYLIFGYVHFKATKRRIKYKYALKEYEKSCKKKSKFTPQGYRFEPSPQITCKTISDDVKHCEENKKIIDMITNLTTSLMTSFFPFGVESTMLYIQKYLTCRSDKTISPRTTKNSCHSD